MAKKKQPLPGFDDIVAEVEEKFPDILEELDGHHAVKLAVTAMRCTIAGLNHEALVAMHGLQLWAGKADGHQPNQPEYDKAVRRTKLVDDVDRYLCNAYTKDKYEVVGN